MIPLSSPLPLRTTAVWGAYGALSSIPWAYGRVRVTPLQYDRERHFWALCDHPAYRLISITRNDEPSTDGALVHRQDASGRGVALLEVGEALAADETLAVTFDGRPHPVTGELMENPGDIGWDLLYALVGNTSIVADDWDLYRAECSGGGLALGGLVSDAGSTIRAQLDTLARQTGAIWSQRLAGWMALYPGTADAVAWPSFGRVGVTRETAYCSLDAITTVLRVRYDYDWSAADYRGTLEWRAPDAIAEYGERVREWDAGWLHSSSLAARLGERLLGWLARPRWQLSWSVPLRIDSPGPGRWVSLDHPRLPGSGSVQLLESMPDVEAGVVSMAAERAVGAAPLLTLSTIASQWAPLTDTGIEVVVDGDTMTLTITDDEGTPIQYATVTLDGTTEGTTDSAGMVAFPYVAGEHTAHVEAQGFDPYDFDFTAPARRT